MGRHEKPINWDSVERKIEAGCSGTQIAACFRMHHTTFYDRFLEKYGESFPSYSSKYAESGEANIKDIQYQKALEGNIPMLLHLGKTRCKQVEQTNTDNIMKVIYEDARSTNTAEVQMPPVSGCSMDSDQK